MSRMPKYVAAFAAIATLTLLVHTGGAAAATSGFVDTTYGQQSYRPAGSVVVGNGASSTTFSAITTDAQGRPIVASNGNSNVVARLLEDGNFDPAFSAPVDFAANKLLVQPDGKVIAVGHRYTGSGWNGVVARFTPSGNVDTSFGGGDGRYELDLGTTDYLWGATAGINGDIIAVGGSSDGEVSAFAGTIVRLDSAGNGVSSFGSGGVQTIALDSTTMLKDAAVQSNGRIIVSGLAGCECDDSELVSVGVVVGLTPSGQLDLNYGNEGGQLLVTGARNDITDVVLQPGGSLVMMSETAEEPMSNTQAYALARLDAAGDFDADFGDGGAVIQSVGGIMEMSELLLDPAGRLVVTGTTWQQRTGSGFDALVARYSGCGVPDASLGVDGVTLDDFSDSRQMHGVGASFQPDGKLLFADNYDNGWFSGRVTRLALPTSPAAQCAEPDVALEDFAPAGPANPPAPQQPTYDPSNGGYTMFASDGGVFPFGADKFHGSAGSLTLKAPIVGGSKTPSGNGYWLVAADGGIFAYGDAGFYGSTGNVRLNSPIVDMVPTPSGKGYWLVAADGGVFSYGDAKFFGSTGAIKLNKPIVGAAPTASGKGYWLVASDGGVFAFGDASFHGSTGSIKLNQPIVDMAPTSGGNGYWLVASDGGVFAFGDAPFYGSTGSIKLNRPIVHMAPSPSGQGYWMFASDGGVFAFGDARFMGSTGGQRLNAPIVG